MRKSISGGMTLLLLLAAALVFAPGEAAAMRPLVRCESVVSEKFIRTELYFGRDRKGGAEVSEDEFSRFVDEFVTPRFPRGLTVIDAIGQWRDEGSPLTKERSKVLIVIYPRDERRAAGRKIEEIRAEYKRRFAQDSVIRIDMSKSLDISFE